MAYGSLPEDEQNEIIRRRIICKACPFMSSNAVSDPAIQYKTDRWDEHCIHCQCNIDLKTASLTSNCGIEIFNQEHPHRQMPLKWEVYIKPNNDEQS